VRRGPWHLAKEERLSRKTAVGLCALLAAAFAARLVFCALVVGIDRAPSGDEVDYHTIAVNLADGAGYRLENGELSARRPPLYPVVLSILYRAFGASAALARFFQVLLGTALVALVFFATRRLFTPGTAWIAAALTAVNPYLVFISAYVLTENLYAVLLLWGVHLAAKTPVVAGNPRRAGLVGLALGLATLCRPTAWLVALWAAGFGVILGGGPLKGRFARGAVLVAVVFATLLPWAMRNHAVFGRWEFFTLHGGITFYQGNNAAVLQYPQYYGGVAPLAMLPEWDTIKSMSEVESDEATRRMGREFLRENINEVPLLVWRKFVRFWRFRSESGLSGIRSGWWFDKDGRLGKLAASFDVGFLYSVVVVPLFVAGLLAGFKNRRRFVLLVGMVAVHTFMALVFYGSLRMRLPIEPVIGMYAADFCWRAANRIRLRA
jgi:4-amino-4-deoxy-L-arabinose transferase-like glycosyltransferase